MYMYIYVHIHMYTHTGVMLCVHMCKGAYTDIQVGCEAFHLTITCCNLTYAAKYIMSFHFTLLSTAVTP